MAGMNINQAQQLLARLRNTYLAELPARCDDIEQLILALKQSNDGFEELYRLVHSTKGSAGTHSLQVVSVICHDIEDQLSRLDLSRGEVSAEVINLLLQFTDLIRQVVEQARQGVEDFAEFERELAELRYSLQKDRMLILMVEPSRHTRMLCQSALKSLPVQIGVVDDGFEALGMLLRTRYDLLVTAKEAKTLNAEGVIAAVRASDCINRHIRIVMMTSSQEVNIRRASDPDVVIQRSPQMGQQLNSVVVEMLEKAKSS